MQAKNTTSLFILVTLFIVLGGISQSMWWNSPHLVQQDGFGWVAIVLGVSIIVVTGLIYQAERLLAYAYNPFAICASATVYPPRISGIFAVLLLSMFVGGLLLASHHLLVSSWQSNINYSLFGEGSFFPSFALVVANQQHLTGSFGNQLLWLLFSLTGATVTGLILSSRLWLVWMLGAGILAMLVVFAWMFHQKIASDVLLNHVQDTSYNLSGGIQLALDTSLAGIGLIFGLCRWQGYAARAGWLIAAMVILALVYTAHLLGAWQFAQYTWVSSVPNSDRLLLQLPYTLLQTGSPLLYWVWFALGGLLSWLKIALILSFGALIVSRYAKSSLVSTQLAVTLLAGLLALCWLIIGYFGQDSEEESITLLFQILFSGLLYWWYPLHLILLCGCAFFVSLEDHMTYVWRESYILGMMLKFSYLGVIALLVWYLYKLL